jgi:catechol 2,3-dioxygenase-like lactoylglutathione lyase family enzyme
MLHGDWPQHLPVTQVRIARPTEQLERVVGFYRDGLGLPVIGSFSGHDGYDGVMIGLPGASYHLEFTQHEDGSPGNAPSDDNLLVLYIPDRAVIQRIVDRLGELGHEPVDAENPYWAANGAVTIADPDGWRVVLMPTSGIQPRDG